MKSFLEGEHTSINFFCWSSTVKIALIILRFQVKMLKWNHQVQYVYCKYLTSWGTWIKTQFQ